MRALKHASNGSHWYSLTSMQGQNDGQGSPPNRCVITDSIFLKNIAYFERLSVQKIYYVTTIVFMKTLKKINYIFKNITLQLP